MKDLAVAVELPGDADPFWFGFDDVGVPRVVLIREKLGLVMGGRFDVD